MSTMAQNLTLSRPTALVIAAAILAVNAASGLVDMLVGGFPADVPQIGIVIASATWLLGLLAAYGLWTQRRWGLLLTLVLCAFTIWTRAAGMLTSPPHEHETTHLTAILVRVLILVLVLLPDSRRAFRQNPSG